jgi:hypothetical protein
MACSTEAPVLFEGIKIENSFPFEFNGESAKTYVRTAKATNKDATMTPAATFLFCIK